MKRHILTILFALVAVPAMALDLGDPAPEIAAESWVTGEPVDPTVIDGETFYLVEVWSTTCPPCVRSIPILNELQKRYADQGFKIVSFTSDALDDITPFLDEHPMEYSSFVDKEGATTISYMAVDNRNTIPHAFLFDRSGAMVWTGNPLDNLEARVKGVIDGSLNKEKALTIRDARNDLQAAFSAQNVNGMLTALRELESIEPENSQYYQVHYRILTELGAGDPADVKDLMKAWYKGCAEQADAMILLSVVAMDQGLPAFRNPELALAAAKRAYALDSPHKFEAGLNLAETYKVIGRLDLSLSTVRALAKDADLERLEAIIAIEDFYGKLQELGKDPDAEYVP